MISGKKFRRLLEKDSEKAWDKFVGDYFDLICKMIRNTVFQKGEQPDAYSDRLADDFVGFLDHLKEDNLRRLRTYTGENKQGEECELRTWLLTVWINYFRGIFRRDDAPNIPDRIERLSEVHTIAFDLHYRKGYSYSECIDILNINLQYHLSYNQFWDLMDEIDATLTDNQRTKFKDWRLCCMLKSYQAQPITEEESMIPDIPDTTDNLEDVFIREESQPTVIEGIRRMKACLWECISSLPVQQRLFIKLTYWYELKPKEIAKLMKFDNKQVSNGRRDAEKKLTMCVEQNGYPLTVIANLLAADPD